MPTPVGHALGGVAVAWLVDLAPGDRRWRTAVRSASWLARAGGGATVACAVLGAVPDLDLLVGGHRTFTHSLTAVALVAAAALGVAGRVRRPMLRVVVMYAAAYGSHLLLDWLSVDDNVPRGIQLLWPFSDRWFIAARSIFPPTERRGLLTVATWLIDMKAVAVELAILVPIVAGLWLIRVKALAGLAPELAGGDHAAEEGTRTVLRVAQSVVQDVENRDTHVEADEVGER